MSVDPVTNSLTVSPMTGAQQLLDQIEGLRVSISKSLPNYEHLLHTIHQSLLKNPDTVHLLSEEQIGIICSGLSKKTGVVIAAKEAKKKVASGKVTLSDLL